MEGLTENEAAYFAAELSLHETKYLTGTNPRQQSGFGRDEQDWKHYREAVTRVSTATEPFSTSAAPTAC